MKSLVSIKNKTPSIEKNVFITDTSRIIGDVVIKEGSSIWYGAVLRGDVMPIRIGKEVNIQDGAILHGTHEKWGVDIGDRVTIGHRAILHGCSIGSRCLIGMGAIVMDGVELGEDCIVGAGALVTGPRIIPPGSLVIGSPAQIKRPLTLEEKAFLEKSADNYLHYQTWYGSPF